MAQATFKSLKVLQMLALAIPKIEKIQKAIASADTAERLVTIPSSTFTNRALQDMLRIEKFCSYVNEVTLTDLEWFNIDYHYQLAVREKEKLDAKSV